MAATRAIPRPRLAYGLDLEAKTRTRPAGLGRCARCGGQVVGRISFPGDPDERRCIQCGRSGGSPSRTHTGGAEGAEGARWRLPM